MKIKTNVTQRRKARSSGSTPYPHQKWHGSLPDNPRFCPTPVWNAPPPSMQPWPAQMPQNQLMAYHPQSQFMPCGPQNNMMTYDSQSQFVSYDSQTNMMAYESQNNMMGYNPQNNMVAYDPPPPPPVPNATPLPPHYLFHYTDHTGMCSIVGESYIRKSCPAQTRYGEGVYLTAVPPNAPDNVILMNNWNDDGLNKPNSAWNGSKAARLQYCFVILSMNLTPWALEKVWDCKGRNIWVYRSEITLGDKVVALKRRW